ncbi:Uma2 family endonuclease [Baaleninema simplex]|uniref:Uma2 family endonuclease n=1 Tax=Baaleninema simplex TaxID=2862350 RepID=UPI00034D371A|nr:Uma2 family endonuclease [Baaleninema simplex]
MSVVTPSQPLSFESYCSFDDGTATRYELVNGRLKAMNPPSIQHIVVAKFLERAIDAEIQRLQQPWMCLREAGVRTGFAKSRLPDLMVVAADAAKGLWQQSAILQVTPLWVVEIVSPSSVEEDYRYKRSEYGAIEVPEYWIVDPLEAKVTVLYLEAGFYEEAVFGGEVAIASRLFPELQLSVNGILNAKS